MAEGYNGAVITHDLPFIAAMQAITVAVPFYMQNSPNEGHNDGGWDGLTERLNCRRAYIQLQDV